MNMLIDSSTKKAAIKKMKTMASHERLQAQIAAMHAAPGALRCG
jgi:hypothetical protein